MMLHESFASLRQTLLYSLAPQTCYNFTSSSVFPFLLERVFPLLQTSHPGHWLVAARVKLVHHTVAYCSPESSAQAACFMDSLLSVVSSGSQLELKGPGLVTDQTSDA